MKELYYQLYHLWKIEPELVVTGSLSLYWHSMLNREPTDLDLLVPTIVNDEGHIFNPFEEVITKEIKNKELLKYLNSQLSIRDRGEVESDPMDITFSCIGQDSKVKIDLFPLDIKKENTLTKIITTSTEDGEVAFEIAYSDWNYIVPYKIKYYTGNSKHYADIEYIKGRLEEVEGTEDA